MYLREAILKRRSVRVFREEEIPPDAVEAMKEAILWAPSAGNLQAWKFYFVTRADTRTALGRCSYQKEIFESARLIVVGCTDERIVEEYGERGRELYAVQDVSASVQNLLLTAHAHGLGAVWIGAFDPERLREVLDLPSNLEPVAMVPIGFPGEDPKPPERRSAAEAFVDVD